MENNENIENTTNTEKKKFVLFVIPAGNFRDEEYFEPKKILETAGYKIVTASSDVGEFDGKLGGIAHVDFLFSEVYVLDYDAIVFVGGPGVVKLWDDWRAHELAKIFFEKERKVCAICSAPVILARAGLLQDKNATCFERDKSEIERHGAKYTGNKTEIDGNIITADGAESSRAFGELILKEIS